DPRSSATLSHPFVIMVSMQPATTLHFATAARVLGREARARGLDAPGFRSPPRLEGADRTLRRRVRGAAVAVRVRGRPGAAVGAGAEDVPNDVLTSRTDGGDRCRVVVGFDAFDDDHGSCRSARSGAGEVDRFGR